MHEAPRNAGVRARRFAWWALCVAVVLVHLLVADGFADNLLGEGSGSERARISHIDVSFVKELALSLAAPAALAPAAPTLPAIPAIQRIVRPVPLAQPVAQAASQPAPNDTVTQDAVVGPASSAPLPDDAVAVASGASAAPDEAEAVSAPPAELPASAASAVAEAAAPPIPSTAQAASEPATSNFEWPPSTRLSYALSGNYLGEIHGSAQVEWIRQDQHYQVHLDVVVGPSFAPLLSRRMASEGDLGEGGLSPRRYEEVTKMAFRDPRVMAIGFEPNRVLLPGNLWRATLPGIQDTASQFVQLTWLFRTQPQKLRAGETIEVPLALPRRVQRFVYDVIELDELDTPVGKVPAWHLKPRPLDKPMGELSLEIWFAPALDYLPVRFVIRQDAQTYADLLLERLPQQAAK